MKIQSPQLGTSQLVRDAGNRLPFEALDTSRSGRIGLAELAAGVQRAFPGLTEGEASHVASAVFNTAQRGGTIGRAEWTAAERMVFDTANAVVQQRQAGPQAPTPWGAPTPNMPPPLGDGFGTARPPAYGQQPSVPLSEADKGAVRTAVGLFKQLPVIGNILNGIDFIRDLGKVAGAFLDPRKSAGDKLKASTDLLFHGIGMLAPNVGGIYDMAQGAARATLGSKIPQFEGQTLPPWQFDPGRYPPVTEMPNAWNAQAQQPNFNQGYQQPLSFPGNDYSSYMADYMRQLDGNHLGVQPNPFWEYPQFQTPNFPYPQSYGYPQLPSRWDKPLPPAFQTHDVLNPSPLQKQANTEVLKGGARMGVGVAKFVPVLGNVLNGIDFVRDIGKFAKSLVTPNTSTLKAGADLLFHGIGTIAPGIGAAYDVAQGAGRIMTNDTSRASVQQKYLQQLPEYQRSWAW